MNGERGKDARREPWHAVRLVPGPRSCATVEALRSQRFLSAEAPRLPLPGCALRATCACVYRHYADRRAGPRRAVERGFVPARTDDERRQRADRRADEAPGDESPWRTGGGAGGRDGRAIRAGR